MRIPGSAAELEARRRRAAEFLRERMAPAEVARLVGASLSSVKRWKRAFERGGPKALAAVAHAGPKPRLTIDQKQELVAILRRGPLAAGFPTDLWTCDRVAEVVRKTFDVSYHPDHLGRILHDLGFTPQKPRVVARERDEAAVAHWRRYRWPAIKKKRDV